MKHPACEGTSCQMSALKQLSTYVVEGHFAHEPMPGALQGAPAAPRTLAAGRRTPVLPGFAGCAEEAVWRVPEPAMRAGVRAGHSAPLDCPWSLTPL